MNSLKLWLTLRVHGRKAYEELIDSQLRLARIYSARSIQTPATPAPSTSFRIKGPGLSPARLAAAHASIVDEATRDGQRWISETVVNGRSVMRMMVILKTFLPAVAIRFPVYDNALGMVHPFA